MFVIESVVMISLIGTLVLMLNLSMTEDSSIHMYLKQ